MNAVLNISTKPPRPKGQCMYNTNIPYHHILITLILGISEDNFYEQHNACKTITQSYVTKMEMENF